MSSYLVFLLRAAAVAQFAIAILNFSLVRLMNWRADLERAPLLINEVFRIHVFFISITLAIFAALTWRFAVEMAQAAEPVFVWLSSAIAIFWAVRSLMQWSHYSASHWRGQAGRTVIHWLLFFGYGALALVYFTAAIGQ